MLLMLDYGNFFEFRSGDTVVPLEGVECGKVYADAHHVEQRPVALRDRRYGGIHLDESLTVSVSRGARGSISMFSVRN